MKRLSTPIIFFFLALLAPISLAFDANAGPIDLNFGTLGIVSEGNVASGTTISGDVLVTSNPTGTFQTTDGGIKFKSGTYFDNSLPVVTITNPTSAAAKLAQFAMTYSAVAPGNPVKKFWIQVDSTGWVDNGLNTSYSITGLSIGAHTVYLVASDAYDVNSTTASTSFNVVSSLSTGTAVGDTTTTTTTTPTTEVATGAPTGSPPTTADTAKPTLTIKDIENPANVVEKKVFETVEATVAGGIAIAREAEQITVKTATGGTTPVYSFTAKAKNSSDQTYKDVKVREIIPKAVASDVSQITFKDYPQKIIKADPEVEWLVEELKPGQEAKFQYYVTSLADKSIAANFDTFVKNQSVPTVNAQVKETAAMCLGVDCDDSNICTEDSCIEGQCYHAPREDGLNCGEGMSCKAGQCVPSAPPAKTASGGIGTWEIVIAIIIVIVIAVGVASLGGAAVLSRKR
ncbi:MAG: hypothetical protein HY544_00840 [Candidatus Diapherotrites archaeon]|uniref:DUF11 domain-containing protein n=1 Tax=Candidatus Iainarchaeum sp. TaxID=3101447 RepID=A0A8T3YPC1_9ARCH|nr:hypothetical protein [Candidatus Diapherotrites archaeon]